MAESTTKIYRNNSEKTLNVLGVGEIPAGEQVSVTTAHHPHVILENYPGLAEVSNEAGPEVPSE